MIPEDEGIILDDAVLRTGTYLESCETPEGAIFGAWSEELKVVFNATDEQIAAAIAHQEQEQTNITARQYLNDTDWYVTRFQETGVAIPNDITVKRQEARESIV